LATKQNPSLCAGVFYFSEQSPLKGH